VTRAVRDYITAWQVITVIEQRRGHRGRRT
jgi:hypothetical protein